MSSKQLLSRVLRRTILSKQSHIYFHNRSRLIPILKYQQSLVDDFFGKRPNFMKPWFCGNHHRQMERLAEDMSRVFGPYSASLYNDMTVSSHLF